jgi:ubiquinone/menaquinone biosynthesis C-methylase UbiE
MKDDSVETFWEIAARTKMGAYLTRMETSFFLDSIAFSPRDLVCDIGAGAGKFSLIAAQKDANVVALDIDLHGLRRLKAKDNRISVIVADAKAIPLKDNIASAAFTFEVVDYIPELKKVLFECKRILKSQHPLVFSFGNLSSLKSKVRQLRGKRYMHSYGEAISDLQEYAFKIEKKQGFNWLPFNRTSNNPLIPIMARAEGFFGVRKLARWSPWVLVKAVKVD